LVAVLLKRIFHGASANAALTSTLLKQMCNSVARTSFTTQAASEERIVLPLISLLLEFMQERDKTETTLSLCALNGFKATVSS
jgi:hypothetical protein